MKLLRRIATEPAPDLRSLRPQWPAGLAAVVASLLERQPAQRAEDGSAVADSLLALRKAWPGGAMSR